MLTLSYGRSVVVLIPVSRRPIRKAEVADPAEEYP
jgi:hypothetical protein